ncbi:sensor histidine kinase [Pedobacter sp. R-06]|uniref:sensor histidine kinase n=1 Tax=Pedobacter sp. R-06 TaxID=3404051 RepID=UPI003CFA4120
MKPKTYSVKCFLKTYRWHIFAWLLFALYESTAVAVVAGRFADPINYMVHYPINILLFYVHSMVLLPFCANKKTGKIPIVILLSLSLLLIYIPTSYTADLILDHWSQPAHFPIKNPSSGFILSTLWRGFYFMSFATTYFYITQFVIQQKITSYLEKKAIEKELKEKEMDIELARAKNAYIRAQINPHFLFSTLTFIYDRALGKEPKVGKAILYLSKLMRYAIESDHGPEKIPLLPEILQVENLIELSRIKQPELYLEFDYTLDVGNVKIIPLVLLSLIENMIKHGNLSMKSEVAKISLKQENGFLILETDNLKNTGINDTGFHTGLNNLKKRLSYSYGANAGLTYYSDSQSHFIVTARIPI